MKNIKFIESTLVERIYIYLSFVPLVSLFMLLGGWFQLIIGGHDAVQLYGVYFPIISLFMGMLGVPLVIRARKKGTIFWILITATLMASSYWLVIFGRFYLKIF